MVVKCPSIVRWLDALLGHFKLAKCTVDLVRGVVKCQRTVYYISFTALGVYICV